MKVDWNSNHTQILFNNRLPQEDVSKWQCLLERITAETGPERLRQEGHFWIGTSGSSGRGKWVAVSRRALLVAAEGANQHLESGRADRWLHVIPSFHVGGLSIWARAYLSGAEVIDMGSHSSKWDPSAYAETARATSATLSSLVPTQVFDLVKAGLVAPSSLRAIVVGGGALAPALYFAARRLGWPVLPSYGLTECCSQVATAELSSLELQEVSEVESGLPQLKLLPHIEARYQPHFMVRSSQEGLIELRSGALLTGYALETENGVEFLDPMRDEWFTTEDFGSVQGQALTISGRWGSFIKIGGESVDFARLEKIFDEVRLEVGPEEDLVLMALPDPRLGHATHLVGMMGCEGRDDFRILVETFNRRVLPIERIREYHQVDAIPRSPLGKLLKADLMQRLSRAEVISRGLPGVVI